MNENLDNVDLEINTDEFDHEFIVGNPSVLSSQNFYKENYKAV